MRWVKKNMFEKKQLLVAVMIGLLALTAVTLSGQGHSAVQLATR
jgi:hypothetical protein